MDSLYDCEGPTAWAGPPPVYSYSSLVEMGRCPRQWQLRRSLYGDRKGFPSRPNPAAAEGDIVHQTLDLLHRELALEGLPAIGTEQFRRVVARVDLRARVEGLVREHEETLASHPRGLGVGRLRRGTQELVNKVIRLLRDSYAGTEEASSTRSREASRVDSSSVSLSELLGHRSVLSELELTHPGLSFRGIVDLVYVDDGSVVVADFKSGSRRPEHEKQVLFYALLWWRSSGVCPSRVEVRYLGDSWHRAVDEDALLRGERLLSQEIASAEKALAKTPAEARVADHCGFCPVRQFCEDYWEEASARSSDVGSSHDLDVKIESVFDHGLKVQWQDATATLVAESHRVAGYDAGDRLRVLGATSTDEERVFEVRPWTELFRVARGDDQASTSGLSP